MYHFGLFLNTHATFPTSLPRLQAQHIGTEALCLSQLEANLSIGVQAKGQWGLGRHGLINVLQHLQLCIMTCSDRTLSWLWINCPDVLKINTTRA